MLSKEKPIKTLTIDKLGSMAAVKTNFGNKELPTLVKFSKEDTEKLLNGEKIAGSLGTTIYKINKKTKIIKLSSK